MAMTVVVRIRGDKAALRTVKALEKTVNELPTSVPEKLAQSLQRHLIKESPVWSGILKKSWRRIRSKRNAWRVQSTEYRYLTPYKLGGPMIKPRKSYAAYPQKGSGTTKASSIGFVDRAIDRLEQQYKKVLEEPLDKAMKR